MREHTLAADILIVAVGVPGLVTGEMVREGAIVIDIGINALRRDDGSVRLVGDVDTASVEPIAEAVSPVPAGVGPITDMWLLRNTIDAAWLQAGAALSERHRAERTGPSGRADPGVGVHHPPGAAWDVRDGGLDPLARVRGRHADAGAGR